MTQAFKVQESGLAWRRRYKTEGATPPLLPSWGRPTLAQRSANLACELFFVDDLDASRRLEVKF